MDEPLVQPLPLRVFLASPGDVADERALALRVIDHLPYDPFIRGLVTLEVVAWDKPGAGAPMLATMTPQEAISRYLPKPSECDIVVMILWARIGTQLPPEFLKPDGSPYASGTEWEYHDAAQAAMRSSKPKILLYRRLEPPKVDASDPEYVEKGEQWQRVEKFFSSLRNPDGSIRGGCNSYETPEEFRDKLDHHLRALIREFLKLGPLPASGRQPFGGLRTQPALWAGPPFPGLRPFTAEDSPIFFGRGHETDGLVRKLADSSNRFIVVVGASGSGKSSVVAAGLRSRLRDNAIPGSVDWVWVRFTPGELSDNPFLALAAGLAPLVQRLGRRTPDLADEFRFKSSAITEVAEAALTGKPAWSELMLFIDQFEELFTVANPSHLLPFISLMRAATQSARIRTVATLRSDFYRHCVEVADLAELLRGGSYPLAAPGPGALLQMIEKPAERAGLIFEEGLVERIVTETGTEPGALPLMAFALSELYERRDPDGRLSYSTYQEFDGVQGAIGRRAEQTYAKLEASVQAALGTVFRELVEVDERGVATRRRAGVRRLEGAAAKLADALTDARLLVKSGGEGRESVVEIAHEALFTAWPRLAKWIEDAGEDLRLLRQVRLAAAEWERQDRREEFLWPDKRLMPVWTMIERLQPDLDETTKRFVRPFDPNALVEEINDPETTHERRAYIGDHLGRTSDNRPGVGLRPDGLPDITWLDIPAGEISLDGVAGTCRVEPFQISKHVVTWVQYRAFLEAPDGYSNSDWWDQLARSDQRPGEQYRGLDNHPAENVSWFDGVAYCRWLTIRLGYEIRLPTEWEWQQAATGGSADREFPWGSTWDSRHANTAESGLNRTTAVGVYPQGASPFGVLDLSGNVWEWCLNEYAAPERVEVSGDAPRVVRGGSFFYKRESARSRYRDRDLPYWRNLGHGFRIVGLPASRG